MASTLAMSVSPLSFSQQKSHFHNPVPPPTRQHNLKLQNTPYLSSLSSSSTIASNRNSLPNHNILWQQHQHQMERHFQKENQTSTQAQAPSPPPAPTRPRLSLDTSRERLNATVVCKGDKSYLKLFSPVLVESPVSFLDSKQLSEDKKLWEHGPDAAFQKQLDLEKRDAYKARSMQQVRGLIMGLWLGCLMGLLILQQTAARVYLSSHLVRATSSPLVLILAVLTWVAVLRSGTRSMVSAIATCTAVLTCFATLIVNESSYSAEFHSFGLASGSP
ncbi:MAG: hypothetical protein BYD32DRAFT_403355 [Podila humilis]|nr:MAG: hypothetical protein BYD32DRAFT_403355 [Podila humilis]